MKKSLPFIIFSFMFLLSCKKSDYLDTLPQSDNNTSSLPAPSEVSEVSIKLDGQPVIFSTINQSRSLTGRYLYFSASNDSLKLELKLNNIIQIGNSAGVIIGSHEWKFYKKNQKSEYEEYIITSDHLEIYCDMPLTHSMVRGNFRFVVSKPGSMTGDLVTDGYYKLIF